MRFPKIGDIALTILIALPALPILAGLPFEAPGTREFGFFYHGSGEWSARLLIVTLAITPICRFLRPSSITRWLQSHRRWFGVASFLYALLHVVVYLADNPSIAALVKDLGDTGIVVGWLGFIAMIPLALTSTNNAIRAMGGHNWKRLQRTAYAVAGLAFAHWILASHHPEPAFAHFGFLVMLELTRLIPARRKKPLRSLISA